jgi:hypothetical protein
MTILSAVQSEITNAVCTQRPLDETFATMSNASTFTLVYFGSVDGTWRAYPGRVKIHYYSLSL